MSVNLKNRLKARADAIETDTSNLIRRLIQDYLGNLPPEATKPRAISRIRTQAGKSKVAATTVRYRLAAIIEAQPDADNAEVWQRYEAEYGDDCEDKDYQAALRGLADKRRM